jgi:hypothetical protein
MVSVSESGKFKKNKMAHLTLVGCCSVAVLHAEREGYALGIRRRWTALFGRRYDGRVKPLPAAKVPGDTDAAILRGRERMKAEREKKKAAKKEK